VCYRGVLREQAAGAASAGRSDLAPNLRGPADLGTGRTHDAHETYSDGSQVKEGDLIAVFDSTQQTDLARGRPRQVRRSGPPGGAEAGAESRGRREAHLRPAPGGADLSKAEIELKKGPVLPEIDRLKAEVKASRPAVMWRV